MAAGLPGGFVQGGVSSWGMAIAAGWLLCSGAQGFVHVGMWCSVPRLAGWGTASSGVASWGALNCCGSLCKPLLQAWCCCTVVLVLHVPCVAPGCLAPAEYGHVHARVPCSAAGRLVSMAWQWRCMPRAPSCCLLPQCGQSVPARHCLHACSWKHAACYSGVVAASVALPALHVHRCCGLAWYSKGLCCDALCEWLTGGGCVAAWNCCGMCQ
jgi:hypothetical protein